MRQIESVNETHHVCELGQVIGERAPNYKHEVFISMLEIYNENIRDLLADPKKDRRWRSHP